MTFTAAALRSMPRADLADLADRMHFGARRELRMREIRDGLRRLAFLRPLSLFMGLAHGPVTLAFLAADGLGVAVWFAAAGACWFWLETRLTDWSHELRLELGDWEANR